MWAAGSLVGQGHDPRQNRRRQAGPTDAVLGVARRSVRERLRLTDQIARIRIPHRGDVRYSTTRATLCREHALLDNADLVVRLGEQSAHTATRTIEPHAWRSWTPGRRRRTLCVPAA